MQSTNGRDGRDRLPKAVDYYQTHDISQEMEAKRWERHDGYGAKTSDLLIRGLGVQVPAPHLYWLRAAPGFLTGHAHR